MEESYPVFNVELDIEFEGSDDKFTQNRNDNIINTFTLQDDNISIFSTIGKRNSNLDTYSYIKKGSVTLLAVFDGHGDDKVAKHLQQNTLKMLENHKLFDFDQEKALREVISKIEEQVLQKYEKGSTLLVAIINEKQIIAANIGDSKLFGVLKHDKTLVPLTLEHNLSNQEEVAKIISKGGLIFKRGSQHRINGQLNISRSIGDRKYKKIISSQPDIYRIDHSAFKKVILATDGFYRHQLFTQELYKKSLKQIQNKIRVGKFGIGFNDNATVVCFKFKE